jgi:hypothetical protein
VRIELGVTGKTGVDEGVACIVGSNEIDSCGV